MIEPYHVTVCQPVVAAAFGPGGELRRDVILGNLERCGALIEAGSREWRSRLFVLPQFCFQGFASGRSRQDWIAAALSLGGPELRELGRLARSADAYVAGTAYEVCEEFPDRYWNTAFIVGPDGTLALAYRKHYSLTPKTRPGDVYDAYVARFGAEALFPVIDTPLGKLGAAVAADVSWPEVTRCLALKGAELVVNPHASLHWDLLHRPGGDLVRAVRAFENLIYLAVANVGGIAGYEPPAGQALPPSEIIDYTGRVIATAQIGPDRMATARVDIEALRRFRASPNANFLTQLQPHLHADAYRSAELWPKNASVDRPIETGAEILELERQTWLRMTASGVFHGAEDEAAAITRN